ncbi:MAG: ParB/RepB/Spo0J family partition protein [Clostridia bacterium]|nr:ParB/RepB/Spo0J family partition protein [Clostridia bacterium]
MAKKQQRGLGSLNPLEDLLTDNMVEAKGAVSTLRLSEIEPRADQPRKTFSAEALTQLADSIAAHGVLQPLLVRPSAVAEGYYEIIAGERRWRAAKMAGLTEVPVIVMDSDELHAAEIALIENVQRADLNPVEEAFGYRRLIDEFGLTQEQVAAQVGKSRPAVANALRLLDLPAGALALLRDGEISAGHARALLGLRRREEIDALAEKIAAQDLSVRAVEDAVRRLNAIPDEVEEEETPSDEIVIDYFAELERKTMSLLGRKVKIAHSPRKRVLELTYEDNEDLEQLLVRLCGSEIIEEG